MVAIGGGSAMDCAKGVGISVVYPNKSLEKFKGILKVHKKIPTLVAIPTTAGTGSECTVATVLTNEKTHQKYAINDLHLVPRFAVLAPELT
ncbi:MAG: iron-containing alcohol dehydrogenase, partial [Clostridia bacterium]|nr:iron-containing alcohol dehydrogenase [Clostridia bacterium]